MLETGTFENVGNSYHAGLDPEQGTPGPLRKVVYGHSEWPKGLQPEGSTRRAERLEFDGEPIVAFFLAREGREALTNVMRFDVSEGRIARIRSYGYCPDTIRVIAEALGLPAWTGIYRAPTPAPGQDWPGDPVRRGERPKARRGAPFRALVAGGWTPCAAGNPRVLLKGTRPLVDRSPDGSASRLRTDGAERRQEMPRKSFVVRSSGDGWMVQREGRKAPLSTHSKKDVAVRKGRSMARRAHGVLKIKARSGKLQAKRSYAA